MKKLPLGSHIVVWWDTDLTRLSAAQRTPIADPANQIIVSAASGWEVGMKVAAGKLTLSETICELVQRWRFIELPVTMTW